jgi:hypothetical protein
MKKFLVGALVAYLLGGILFAANNMLPQMWTCPDDTAPHGYMTYGDPADLPRDDCQPTVTLSERVEWFAFAVSAWLPLIVGKGISNATEP